MAKRKKNPAQLRHSPSVQTQPTDGPLINSPLKAPLIMGVINLSADSFSDGHEAENQKKIFKKIDELILAEADILDIGAEASGPHSKNRTDEEQIEKIIPVIKYIRKRSSIPISIDTYKSTVAEICLQNGANIINDVTALRGDKKMAASIAKYNAETILMYAKDNSPRTTIKKITHYRLLEKISLFFKKRIAYAEKEGINKDKIIIDPGMGHFISALPLESYKLIAELPKLKKLKQKILIGISRKSFLGGNLANNQDRQKRDERGLPLHIIASINGASIVRVHNVRLLKNFIQEIFP